LRPQLLKRLISKLSQNRTGGENVGMRLLVIESEQKFNFENALSKGYGFDTKL